MRLTTTAAIAVASAFGAGACGFTSHTGPVVREQHAVERGAAASASVSIEMHAGELTMKPGANTLFQGDFKFNVDALKPRISYTVNGSVGELKVSQGSASGNIENTWNLSLDNTTPLDLRVHMGAGDADLALGNLNLQNLAIRQGAGDLDVDLRGAPSKSYGVLIQAGAGDITVRLPVGVGISANTNRLVGDVRVAGLVERDGRWINPRAEASPVTIDVRVQHAVGDIRLLAE